MFVSTSTALAALGEVQLIDIDVALDLEMGAIIRRCHETGSPARSFTSSRKIPTAPLIAYLRTSE
jgi:hypothetical protein